MLVVASTKFSIISLINSGRANLFLPILSPKKGILLEGLSCKAGNVRYGGTSKTQN